MEFVSPRLAKAHLRDPLEDVCAAQYVAINRAILDGRSVPPAKWTEIFYEDLVNDPVSGFRRAFDVSELEFTSAIERHCAEVLSKPYNAFS